MKKMISCLTALAILAAVPAATAFAADTAAVQVTSEGTSDKTDINDTDVKAQSVSADEDFSAITGEWKEVNGNGRVFNISADGIYTVTYPDNTTDQGNIRIGNNPDENDYKGSWYVFYNGGGRAWIGFPKSDSEDVITELKAGEFVLKRKSENSEDTGNKHSFPVTDEYPAIGICTASLIDTWKDAENDRAVLTITDGISIYNSNFEYTDGKETVTGYVELEYNLTPDGDREYWYNFYTIDGTFWNGFSVSGDIPLNDIYSGKDGAKHFVRQIRDEKESEKSDVAMERMNCLNEIMAIMNASPVYTVEDPEVKGYVRVTDRRFTSIPAFKFFISGTCTGELKEDLFNSCDDCFIEKDGSLYVKTVGRSYYQFHTENGVTITAPAMDHFIATAKKGDALNGFGRAFFAHDNGKWLIEKYTFDIFDDTFTREDLENTAVEKMSDLNDILALMASSPLITDEKDSFVYEEEDGAAEYVRVTDARFSSINALKDFISNTCKGELEESLLSACDMNFAEIKGSLYVKKVYRSYYIFLTDGGADITDIDRFSFTATTFGYSDLDGNGRTRFILSGSCWYIESYEFGDFFDNGRLGLSAVAGTWNETDIPYSRTLTIRTDGTFTFVNQEDSALYGSVKTEFPEGSDQTWFMLYDKNGEFFTRIEVDPTTFYNDLYTGPDYPMHFVRYIEPEHKYSSDELREMAANDYEKKTGIRPASTRSMTNSCGSVTVVMRDENGYEFDAYTVDPDTGIGEMFSDGSSVNLPQTGNNSLGLAGALAGASVLTLLGIGAVAGSGIIRKKEYDE